MKLRSILQRLIGNLTFISLQKLKSNIPSWGPVIMEWLKMFPVLHTHLPPYFWHYCPPALPKWAWCAAITLQQGLHGQPQISNIRKFPQQTSKAAQEVKVRCQCLLSLMCYPVQKETTEALWNQSTSNHLPHRISGYRSSARHEFKQGYSLTF